MGTANKLDLQRCLDEARVGNQRAFADLVAHFNEPVEQLARRLGAGVGIGDSESYEDIRQETFLRVWQALPRYRHGADRLKTFVFRIALNTIYNERRAERARNLRYTTFSGMMPEFSTPEEEIYAERMLESIPARQELPSSRHFRGQMRRTLTHALSKIAADKAALVVGHEIEGQSYEDLAGQLGLPNAATARRRATVARSTLRRELLNSASSFSGYRKIRDPESLFFW